ncbi:MSHA biogenesis protein MshP [Vibrio ponticus]|uniref:MSHA biogenesis protein MshP n=1 Tax=Vibrio ponticus TaxID=265668 RepID=A0ABX3FHB3_9VIBR|nr:MSHA biogenesis protein MshP [Vibrio ponticus]OLQ92862.1 MSHA biogenesis protein MshP [Vibrio ponticus]
MSHRVQQQGSLLIVVVFVLVVMGFLATQLSRFEWSNHDAHSKDVLGTQAWLLAQSVNEQVLTRFYPLTSTESKVAEQCDGITFPDFVDATGVFLDSQINCTLEELSCSPVGTLDEMNYFKLRAQVSCGSGKSLVERTEEIWVREAE